MFVAMFTLVDDSIFHFVVTVMCSAYDNDPAVVYSK